VYETYEIVSDLLLIVGTAVSDLYTLFSILQDFQEKSAYFRISEEKLQISGLHKFSPQIQTQRCPQRLKDLMNGDRHATTRTVASSALQLGILADWLHSSSTHVLSAFTCCWAFLGLVRRHWFLLSLLSFNASSSFGALMLFFRCKNLKSLKKSCHNSSVKFTSGNRLTWSAALAKWTGWTNKKRAPVCFFSSILFAFCASCTAQSYRYCKIIITGRWRATRLHVVRALCFCYSFDD